jgi:hypothetical protein
MFNSSEPTDPYCTGAVGSVAYPSSIAVVVAADVEVVVVDLTATSPPDALW